MYKIIFDSVKTGVVTEQRPFDARPPFGFPVIDFTRCTMCDECARVCPTAAIQTETAEPGERVLALAYGACIQCRECVSACPEHAITPGRDAEVAAYSRNQLRSAATFDVDAATGQCTFKAM